MPSAMARGWSRRSCCGTWRGRGSGFIADSTLPSILFIVFAVFSSLGSYFLAAHFRGRTSGILAALLALLFFAALSLGLLALMPAGSLPPRSAPRRRANVGRRPARRDRRDGHRAGLCDPLGGPARPRLSAGGGDRIGGGGRAPRPD